MRQNAALCVFALICMVAALAVEPPQQTPKPIPADRQEELSRALLDAKDAQIELMGSAAYMRMQAANARIEDLLQKLSKDFGAPGCKLTKDKTWDCPKETPTSEAKK